jgi:hypothetical protein
VQGNERAKLEADLQLASAVSVKEKELSLALEEW